MNHITNYPVYKTAPLPGCQFFNNYFKNIVYIVYIVYEVTQIYITESWTQGGKKEKDQDLYCYSILCDIPHTYI